jgi:hypothetical protein
MIRTNDQDLSMGARSVAGIEAGRTALTGDAGFGVRATLLLQALEKTSRHPVNSKIELHI